MINYITANLPLFTNPDRKLIIKLEEINTLNFEQSNFIINAEVSEALKKLIAGRQNYKCANFIKSNIEF